MSEDEIKPVAWTINESLEKVAAGQIGFIAPREKITPAADVPLYDQSAIDRLTAEMDRMRIIKSQDSDHVSFCHAEIDRLTAERDAALADAASLRERMLALEAQRDEFGSREWQAEKSRRKAVAAVNIAYRHLDVESLRVSHCKDLAAIDAARAEGGV